MWGRALQLFSTFGAGVQPGTGLDACECHIRRHQTAERPQRNREHQDAGVLLMPAPTCSQSTGGKAALLSSGAVQGPLKLATPSCGFQGGCWDSGAGRVLALMWILWLCLCLPRACHAGTHQTLPTGLQPWSNRYQGPMATGILGEGKRWEAKECLL